ncbi:MAG: helix-turn-helix domain-containing protein [Actinomycetota bacterium]|nr:helix-turn-helix domain-containing protein [Actinomycetota bacterium]
MPAQTDVGTRFAAALATPSRLRLMAALAEGPRSGAALAAALETDPRAVARHARPLETAGLLERSEGSLRDRIYTLVREPVFPTDVWGQLPLPSRRSAVAAALARLQATAATAVDQGGFDRDDMHFARDTLELDDRGWRAASELLLETSRRLDELASAPAEGAKIRANAVTMLFSVGERGHRDEHEEPPPEFSANEAVEAAAEVVERLDRMITREATPWEAVVAAAEELRVLARARMAETSRSAAQNMV